GRGGPTMTTIKPIELTEEAYANLAENYGGFCVVCRDEAYGVEPDARRYRCESCGANAVFGAEELLIRGVIQFTEDEHAE
ncbi:MAG: hypothetical protein ACKV0T_30090, partial [Planctomycetales bacterium]